jgi:hypothetical protein
VTCSDSLGHIYKPNIGCLGWFGPYALNRSSNTSRTSRLSLVAFDFPSLTRQTGIGPSRVDHGERIDASEPGVGSLKEGVSVA